MKVTYKILKDLAQGIIVCINLFMTNYPSYPSYPFYPCYTCIEFSNDPMAIKFKL